MTEETKLDKRQVVCPLSLKLGVVQNYRVTERPNKGVYESRPVKGTDKWAEEFFEILHKSKEQGGLGQPGQQALKFTHDVGVQARKMAIDQVNDGRIRAPKKNWDANFGPSGGMPLEELKQKYPELYNSTPRKTTTNQETPVSDDDLARVEMDSEEEAADEKQMTSKHEQEESAEGRSHENDLEETADITGEGAYSEEESESFAVEAVAEPVMTDADLNLLIESDDEVQEESDRKRKSAEYEEPDVDEHEIVMQRPSAVADIANYECFTYKDGGQSVTMFKVMHPHTERTVWLEEGVNEIDGSTIFLKIEK